MIQINDLLKKVDGCSVQMYADDTIIYTSHRDIKVIENTPSANITVIKNWFDKNILFVNLKKERQNVCYSGLLSDFAPMMI